MREKKKVINIGRKQKKKERKIPDQRSEENKTYRKFFGPDNIRTILTSKQEKKGNHNLKWSSPIDCHPRA